VSATRRPIDADGNAAYEVHMVRADGTPATVYVDKQFDVVSVVQTGMPAPAQTAPARKVGSDCDRAAG
jgi:hypothetical protein